MDQIRNYPKIPEQNFLQKAARLAVANRPLITNFLLTRFKIHKSLFKGTFDTFNIELTNYCNQKCKFCATGLNNNTRPKGKLDFATFKKAVDLLGPRTVIQFAGYGEPFLNKRLEDFLEYVAVRGVSYNLEVFSNFGIITENRIRGLLDFPFKRLIVSLDAMDRESFIQYKGTDEFEKVFENIKILSDEVIKRGRVKQELVIQMVVTKKNADQVQSFKEVIRSMRLVPKTKPLNTHMAKAPRNQISEFEVPELSQYKHNGYKKTCYWLWGGIMVFWNGDVSICCQDPTGRKIYGNVRDNDIVELLNSDADRCKFRELYFRDPGLIDICRNCYRA
jgi:MoaA/NifB/PqqE/SkfB family radical SAM enzyme